MDKGRLSEEVTFNLKLEGLLEGSTRDHTSRGKRMVENLLWGRCYRITEFKELKGKI